MRSKLAVAVLILNITLSVSGAARRRAVSLPHPDDSSPSVWLRTHAHALQDVELIADRSDLEPLRIMIGAASLVGLGDATHGTHEFYAVKLRIVDFLVREMGFNTVAVEGPVQEFQRINAWVQGGPGDPVDLLHRTRSDWGFEFWDYEEMLTVIQWMHDYNANRGASPAISIAGVDPWDPQHPVDRRTREDAMVSKALELHAASTGTVLWMHQEHIGKIANPWLGERPIGRILTERLGDQFFVIGTLAGTGTYFDIDLVVPPVFPPPPAGTYESLFATAGVRYLLVPLDGNLPAWLAAPANYRTAGITGGPALLSTTLAGKLDAVVYVQEMTPTRRL